tara:strand:+ start:87 stop:656 length:570 start_codon:yes stop_codon:yes gene_type:complete
MIKGDFTYCINLSQFYRDIRILHEDNEGEGYTDHHDEIKRLAPECKSYRELGVMQGATSACAAVAGILDQQLIDIQDDYWKPYKKLWDRFKGLDYKFYKMSDLDPIMPTLPKVDLMLIDSVHHYGHVSKALELHAPSVNKYIILHDTVIDQDGLPTLQQAVNDFTMKHFQWQCIKYHRKNVGYSVLKRI